MNKVDDITVTNDTDRGLVTIEQDGFEIYLNNRYTMDLIQKLQNTLTIKENT